VAVPSGFYVFVCTYLRGLKLGMGNKNPIRSANPIRSDRDPFESDWPIHGVVRIGSVLNQSHPFKAVDFAHGRAPRTAADPPAAVARRASGAADLGPAAAAGAGGAQGHHRGRPHCADRDADRRAEEGARRGRAQHPAIPADGGCTATASPPGALRRCLPVAQVALRQER
jgi:hypothetical protein